MSKVDRTITASMLMVLVSFLICVSSVMAVSFKSQDTQAESKKLLSQRDSIADRVDEIRYLETNYQQFIQLVEPPLGSAQRRVARAEVINKAATDLDLPSMTFVMHPFQPLFNSDSASPIAGYEQAEIELQLMHDTQLRAFLEYLARHTAEEFFITTLRVKRLENPVQGKLENALQANLLVNCSIRWLSYQPGDSDAAGA